MLIIFTFLILIGLCFWRPYKTREKRQDNVDTLCIWGLLIGIPCLIFILIHIPINRMIVNSKIEKVIAVQETVKEARKHSDKTLEKLTITNKIADYNAWVGSMKYWNNTIIDIWVPDRIENIGLIK